MTAPSADRILSGSRRALAVALVVLAACKGSQRQSPTQDPPKPADAGLPDANLDACRQAAARSPGPS